MARFRVPGQKSGKNKKIPKMSGGSPRLSPPVPLVGPLGPQRAKSRPSASRAPRAPLLTPMLGPGPQARKWLPGPKILIFSKSLQEPLGGSGDPPGAARGCRELPGASGGFREPPGPISGSGKVPEKIKSGLNRHLSQQLAAILIPRAPVVPPGLWTRKN